LNNGLLLKLPHLFYQKSPRVIFLTNSKDTQNSKNLCLRTNEKVLQPKKRKIKN
jgi:hypothetical protein